MTFDQLARRDFKINLSESPSVLRFPSLRAPLDYLFLVCCIVLTADVLVPEIWVSGKTKD
jgi:hypothetical protein